MKPKPIPNVTGTFTVPGDFEAIAKSLGFSAELLLWYLAESLCADPPQRLSIIKQGSDVPTNVVPMRNLEKPLGHE